MINKQLPLFVLSSSLLLITEFEQTAQLDNGKKNTFWVCIILVNTCKFPNGCTRGVQKGKKSSSGLLVPDVLLHFHGLPIFVSVRYEMLCMMETSWYSCMSSKSWNLQPLAFCFFRSSLYLLCLQKEAFMHTWVCKKSANDELLQPFTAKRWPTAESELKQDNVLVNERLCVRMKERKRDKSGRWDCLSLETLPGY